MKGIGFILLFAGLALMIGTYQYDLRETFTARAYDAAIEEYQEELADGENPDMPDRDDFIVEPNNFDVFVKVVDDSSSTLIIAGAMILGMGLIAGSVSRAIARHAMSGGGM
jgi:hypothetical protein